MDRDRDRGAVIVEFALILPILMMLLVGIVEFGRAYNAQISLQAAAREGARALALGEDVESAVNGATPVDPDVIQQGPACPTDGSGSATVTLQESFEFSIPFVDLGTKELSATGVMRCGL